MPMPFFVSLFLAIFAYAASAAADAPKPVTAAAATDSAASGSKGKLVVQSETGKRYGIQVTRDSTVSPTAQPSEVKLIGESKGVALVVVDSYPSRPGGMSLCQAGKERFLRIISLVQKAPEETFRVKLESCRDNIELASPGIEWLPASSAIRIHWLLGPAANGRSETRTLRIGQDGKPV
ncbi:MAG: hypothetical protein JWM26_1792 [Betaproteobacteria bacterium]|nr:hypothetical protein [Betaproteobacteria bacterium]